MAYASQIPTDLTNVSGALNLVLDSRLSYETKDDPGEKYFNFLAIPEEYRLTNIGRIDLQSVSLTVPVNNLNNTNNEINVKIDVINSKVWESMRSEGKTFTDPYIKRIKLTSQRCDAQNFESGALNEFASQLDQVFFDWCAMINQNTELQGTWIQILTLIVQQNPQNAQVKCVYDAKQGKITISTNPLLQLVSAQVDIDAIDLGYSPQIIVYFGMIDGSTSSVIGQNTIGQFNAFRDFFGIDVNRALSFTNNSIGNPRFPTGVSNSITWGNVQLQSSTTFFILNSELAVGTSNNFYDSNHDAVGQTIDQSTFFTVDVGDKAPGEIYTKDFDKNSNNTWFYPAGLNLRSTFRIQVANIYGDLITDPGRGFMSINLKCYPM